ncbi:MAG TPA: sarcosine oxidase subunit gamma family protein [Steroidobacteraceae bacterium]|jgi:heterotetrameric sarcosine oxidase gamma subunit|nr:sarcosine oxidase subunit gamma family protein [Steroidobacteraceae bacterium]
MAERRSALAEVLKPGVYGAAGPGPGIEIAELRALAAVQVAAFDAGRAAAAIGTTLGTPAPSSRNGVATAGQATVLWTGPGRWLVVEPESRALASLLSLDCPGDVAAITDLGQARTGLRVEGSKVRDLLAKLCSLDLDAVAFPPGTCAQTQFGHIGVLLYCRAHDGFDVFVPRSFAVSAWESILDAALEFGCRVS